MGVTKVETDWICDQIKRMTADQLVLVEQALEEASIKYLDTEGIESFFYNEIKTRMSTAKFSDGRNIFNIDRQARLRPWLTLQTLRKQEFIKSWKNAEKMLTELGFTVSHDFYSMMIDLVIYSPILREQCNHKAVLNSLESVVALFDVQYPGYRESGMVSFLNSQWSKQS